MFDILIKGLFSLFLIILIHQLFNYLKDSFTKPKIKDLVKKPTEQYKNIYNTINQKNNPINQRPVAMNQKANTINPPESMKHELHDFLNTLEQKSTIQDTSKKKNILEFSSNMPPPPASTTIKDLHTNNTNQKMPPNQPLKPDGKINTDNKINSNIENVGNDITSQFSSY
tara:strand:+ start:1833 stop:2342 length:510 start_codon:yes stop_codon:yes gene_type:complete